MRNFLIASVIAHTVNTCYAVTVTAADTAALKVNIKPLIAQRNGDNNKIDLPEIYDVPYFRYGAGKTAVKLDPVPGDIGFYIVFKSDSNNIKKGDAAQIIPDTFLNFPLFSGVYIGGILMNEPENFIEIKEDNITLNTKTAVTVACETVNVNAKNINLGESAGVALVNEKITAALNSHTHNYVNSGGAVVPTTPPVQPFVSANYINPKIKEA